MSGRVEPTLGVVQVQKRLNVSAKQLHALIDLGELKPHRDFYGRRRFLLRDVLSFEYRQPPIPEKAATPQTHPVKLGPGAKAAAAFKLFDAGKGLREVVVALEVTPAEAENLRQKYAEFGRDVVLVGRDLETVRELIDWHGSEPADLVRAIDRRLRYQYRRGQKNSGLFLGETTNDRGMSSDEFVKRGRNDVGRGEGSLPGDGPREPDSGAGVRSA